MKKTVKKTRFFSYCFVKKKHTRVKKCSHLYDTPLSTSEYIVQVCRFCGFFFHLETNKIDPRIVLDFYARGSLDKVLLHVKFDMEQKCQIISDIVSGLQYVHSKLVIHRDIAAYGFLGLLVCS